MTLTSSTPIRVLRTIQQVRQWRLLCLLNRESVGFVPTMGALHAGHCSLVSQSLSENDRTVVSIFVNPSQFAPHEDLEAYPRSLDTDMETLSNFKGKKVDAIFVPKVSEMYPSGITLDVNKQRGAFVSVLGCSEQLEGAQRPQFFRGVATIVTKLLNVVTPDQIYFGQKDAQQYVVIKNLVKDLLINTKVRVLPTSREPYGLALSSRNAYLTDPAKKRAAVIYEALQNGEIYYNTHSQSMRVKSSEIIERIMSIFNKADFEFEMEYLAVSHPESLEDLEYVEPGVGAIVSTAIRVPKENSTEKIRLLDNILLN
ncbi:unnamed protein product [Debaryomyces fabryi]|nr:unnamed protein product [Debaryomyces fabryi]